MLRGNIKVSEENSQKRRNFTLKLHLDAKDSPDGKLKVVFSRSVRTACEDNELDAALGAYVKALNNTGCMPPDVEGTRTVQFFFRDMNSTAVVPIAIWRFDAKDSYEDIREGIIRFLRGQTEGYAARVEQNKAIRQWMKETGTDIYSISAPALRELCAKANHFFAFEYTEQERADYVNTVKEALMRRERRLKDTDKSALVRRTIKDGVDSTSKRRSVKNQQARKGTKASKKLTNSPYAER